MHYTHCLPKLLQPQSMAGVSIDWRRIATPAGERVLFSQQTIDHRKLSELFSLPHETRCVTSFYTVVLGRDIELLGAPNSGEISNALPYDTPAKGKQCLHRSCGHFKDPQTWTGC